MTTPSEHKRIIKFHLPAKTIRSRYSLPTANSYFSKVLPSHYLIPDTDLHKSQAGFQELGLKSSQARSMIRSTSLSLSMVGKVSSNDVGHELKGAASLPKIGKTLMSKAQNTTQITRSELGCFGVYQILEQREKIAEKLKKKALDEAGRVNAGEEEYEHEQIEEETPEEKNYEYYDAILMKQEPPIQHTRHFRLKHKAEWRISLTG